MDIRSRQSRRRRDLPCGAVSGVRGSGCAVSQGLGRGMQGHVGALPVVQAGYPAASGRRTAAKRTHGHRALPTLNLLPAEGPLGSAAGLGTENLPKTLSGLLRGSQPHSHESQGCGRARSMKRIRAEEEAGDPGGHRTAASGPTSSSSLSRFVPASRGRGQGYTQFPDGNRCRIALDDLRDDRTSARLRQEPPALFGEAPVRLARQPSISSRPIRLGDAGRRAASLSDRMPRATGTSVPGRRRADSTAPVRPMAARRSRKSRSRNR